MVIEKCLKITFFKAREIMVNFVIGRENLEKILRNSKINDSGSL